MSDETGREREETDESIAGAGEPGETTTERKTTETETDEKTTERPA